MRIESFIKDRTHNKELQKYLESKDDQPSQIFIEDTSGDEIMKLENHEITGSLDHEAQESRRQQLAR
jgi:hypothetical protein